MQHPVFFFSGQAEFPLQAGMRKKQNLVSVFCHMAGKNKSNALADPVRDVKIPAEHPDGFTASAEVKSGGGCGMAKQQPAAAVKFNRTVHGEMKLIHSCLRLPIHYTRGPPHRFPAPA